MSRIPISVCIIAKDEEKHIEECLSRLSRYGMEIVVADTGSADRTREIASRYADKVLDYEWVNDFAAARNYCAAQASNNWILALDCDEYVQSVEMPALRRNMQQHPRAMGLLQLDNAAYRWNGEMGHAITELPRFYNRNYYEWKHAIHENIEPKQAGTKEEYFYLPMEVLHVGYLISPEEMRAKQERNLSMLYAALEQDSERSAYLYYQIGQSQHVLHNMDAAIGAYRKAIELEPDANLMFIQTSIIQLATAYAQADRPQESVDLLEQYTSQIQTARFKYTYALALLAINQPLKACLQFVLASTAPDSDKLGEDLQTCLAHIIRLYEQFGQPAMAQPFRERYEQLRK